MKREEALHLQSHELPAAMTQSTYDASIERDLRALSNYHVVFLVDDLVSKVLRSTWTDVSPPPFVELIDWPTPVSLVGQRSDEEPRLNRESIRPRRRRYLLPRRSDRWATTEGMPRPPFHVKRGP
jgi:hypothetical protein